jgi:hypothetical protein
VRIDQAGQQDRIAEVMHGCVGGRLVPTLDANDPLALYQQRGGPEPFDGQHTGRSENL